MERVSFFIDGFNLYHAIIEQPHCRALKWLNLEALCQMFVQPKVQVLQDVFYYTALAWWRQSSVARHKAFISALGTTRTKVVYGEFKVKDRRCKVCGGAYTGHEEKQTDVNIAIGLFRTATEDTWDRARILSADSDLIPAIRTVLDSFPNKRIQMIYPIGRRSFQLTECSGEKAQKIKHAHLKASQFPLNIKDRDGHLIQCPEKWM